MALSISGIAEKAQEQIAKWGEPIDVLPYVPSATSSVYRQRAKQHGDPVSIQALVQMDPTPDQLSEIGHDGDAKGMLTLCRLDLEEAFPAAPTLEDTITGDDQVVVNGFRWRIVKPHYTGRMGGANQILVIVFDHLEGRKHETYP